MQNVSTQKASELPPGVKSAVEQLLGRPIDADEEVSIVAVPSQHLPPSENRAVVARELEAFLNRRADKTKDVPDGEIELAVDEAVDHLRHSRG
jgi:DNA-directed RNA polymerase specialized sigma24 family protein